MSNNVQIIIIAPVFIVLAAIIFKPLKSAFNLDTFPTGVLSVCVSALCIIGMSRSLKGLPWEFLLPYTVLGIAILLMVLISFLFNHFKPCNKHEKKKEMKSITKTPESHLRKERSVRNEPKTNTTGN